MSPSRRSLLCSVGALASLAGCSGVSSDSSSTKAATKGNDTTTPAVSIDDHHALTTFPAYVNVDEGEVTASENQQFLFLTVSGPVGVVQSPSKFTVDLGSEQYRGLTTIGGAPTTRSNPGFPDWFVASGTTSRTLAFRVPRTVRTDEVTLRCCGGSDGTVVPVPSAAVDLLRSSPAFTVESFSVPERVVAGEEVVVRATVSNEDGRDERLYATVGTGTWYPVVISAVPAEGRPRSNVVSGSIRPTTRRPTGVRSTSGPSAERKN